MILTFKKVYQQEVEKKDSCNFYLNNDYASCDEGGNVIIDVLNNDINISSPTLAIFTPPSKGNTVINIDNTITYTATTALQGESDFFVYGVTQGTCTLTAVVYITINDELDPLPTYNSITLHKNGSGTLACALAPGNLVTRYIDTMSFSTATKLFNDTHGLYISPVGYYTNATISRYWNGTILASPVSC